MLDNFTEGILVIAGGFVGGCIATISLVFLNLKKKNNNINKLDTIQ